MSGRHDDRTAIHELKARYFRLMDTKQWNLWRHCFTDDMVFYMEDSALPDTTTPISTDGDTFVEDVSKVLTNAVTVHHGHMPEIDFTGERSAKGIWSMYDWVDDQKSGFAIQGAGHYHELYELGADNRWRIKEIRLTRLRVDTLSPTEPSSKRPWPPAWTRP